jgi:hypothetical protein
MVAAGGMIASDAVHGIVIPVGESRTIDVELFSDGATSGPWTVKASDYAQLMGSQPDLKLTFDKAQGKGGDRLHLTITRLKSDGALGGAGLFRLSSKLGGHESIWIGAVGDAATE